MGVRTEARTTTTIAFDGKRLAADSQATFGNLRRRGTKIRQIEDSIVAVAGCVEDGHRFFEWYGQQRRYELGQGDQPEWLKDVCDSWDCLVLKPEGLFRYGNVGTCIPIEDKQYAIGSGEQLALAAMAMGADAGQAVEIAARLDINTGGPVVVMELPKKKRKRPCDGCHR